MRVALAAVAALLVGLAQPASAQVRNGQEFQLVTAGLTATLLSVEVNHVQVDNTIEVAVVLLPSQPLSTRDGTLAAAEFCLRYSAEVMATIRAQGTRTRVFVFVPLFVRSATEQAGFGFSGETCPLDPPFPAELRATALQNAAAPLPATR